MGGRQWQPAQSMHQTAPPVTRPLVVGWPREPAPVVEQNLGKSASDRAAGLGQCREVSHPGAASMAPTKKCKFTAWSVIDSDVAGLPMLLSNDPLASSSREPTAGAAGETGDLGNKTGKTQGTYPSVLGNTVKTSIVLKSKSSRTLFSDSYTGDKHDTCDSWGLSVAKWSATGDISKGTTGAS